MPYIIPAIGSPTIENFWIFESSSKNTITVSRHRVEIDFMTTIYLTQSFLKLNKFVCCEIHFMAPQLSWHRR